MDNLAKTLRQRRILLGLTAQEMSERAEISWSHLMRIERDERRPSGTVLHKLSPVLDIPEAELLRLAGYLSAETEHADCAVPSCHLDPIVAQLLAKEPVELQRQVLAMKVVARDIFEKD